MSVSESKRVGEKLYLNLQLHDGADSLPLRVFVDIFDGDSNKIVNRREIPHNEGGLFQENVEVMPDRSKISAVYSVFELDGLTFSERHSVSKDDFVRDDSEDNIATLLSRLTEARSMALDNLDIGISTLESEMGAVARFNALLDAITSGEGGSTGSSSCSIGVDLIGTVEEHGELMGYVDDEDSLGCD